MDTKKNINEAEGNAVLPLVGRIFSSGQKIKVELEDGTVWDAEVSEENTVIIDCTPEYMSYLNGIMKAVMSSQPQ